jgi:AcrR family transcriptional regulator
MRTRLTRVEQTERNRALVLAAARTVFLDRGYHGATLEQIAEAAGFSKGVVYSQFESKADLFLSLLEARIEERAAENASLVERLAGDGGVAALVEHLARGDRAEPEWGLLVAEFRVHAARDPELNRRYAAAHARTRAALAEVLAAVTEGSGEQLPFAPGETADVALALATGMLLEQAADPEAMGGALAGDVLTRVLTGAATGAGAAIGGPHGRDGDD